MVKIACIAQVGNEAWAETLYLRKCLEGMKRVSDELVIYLDAPTDNTEKIVREFVKPENLIIGKENMFEREMTIKQILLERALQLSPDWILRLDADELFENQAYVGENNLRYVCEWCDRNAIEGVRFRLIQLWDSNCYERINENFQSGWQFRLFKNTGKLKFPAVKGLHIPAVPLGVDQSRIINLTDLEVLHFGFASRESLLQKFVMYWKRGQRGYDLKRLINEDSLELKKVDLKRYPIFARPEKEDTIPKNKELWKEACKRCTV